MTPQLTTHTGEPKTTPAARRIARRSFTLLEVLIAMSIVIMSIGFFTAPMVILRKETHQIAQRYQAEEKLHHLYFSLVDGLYQQKWSWDLLHSGAPLSLELPHRDTERWRGEALLSVVKKKPRNSASKHYYLFRAHLKLFDEQGNLSAADYLIPVIHHGVEGGDDLPDDEEESDEEESNE